MLNYSLICSARFSDDSSSKWVDYLEYGTTDLKVIGLQTMGIPRHLAIFVISNYPECLTVENMEVVDIDISILKNCIDQNTYPEEYKELESLLDW